MQFVDQAVREYRSDQRSAAAELEVADLVLQAADRIGSYGLMIFEFGAARPLAVVVAEEFPQLLRRCRRPGCQTPWRRAAGRIRRLL
jgi:hypothetical protein